MPRFVVDLGDIDMSSAAQQELSASIQKTVLTHVSDLKYEKPFGTYFPRHWYGIILHPDLNRLPELEVDLGKRMGLGR